MFFSRRKESQFLQLISDDHGRPNLSHELGAALSQCPWLVWSHAYSVSPTVAVLVRDKATEYSLLELAGDIGNIM